MPSRIQRKQLKKPRDGFAGRINESVPKSSIRRILGPFGGPAQKETVVTANVYQYQLSFPAGNLGFTRVPDIGNMDPQAFTTMTPPRTAAGTGVNTLNTMGVFAGQAATRATANDPYQRNFVGFKIDHPGWNCCNVRQWDENIRQFSYVKSSPVVLEITLPDPPISKALPVTITRPAVFTDAGELAAYQALNIGTPATPLWNETRPTGAWQYIIIPPQKGSSIRLDLVVGYAEWQALLQIGYKPQTCRGTTYKCVCAAKGADSAEQNCIFTKLATLANSQPPGTIPPKNPSTTLSGPGSFNTVHKAQETDWCVQYDNGPFADDFTGAGLQQLQFNQMGFDVLAFGSGIVFQFVQYAPPALDGTSTACGQILPLTLTVHSKTTFRQLKTAQQDIGQVCTLPIVGGL